MTTARKSAPRKAAPRKRVPATAPKPQDHKAPKSARESEAQDGYVVVNHHGLELRIPIGGKVPLKAFAAFQAGDELGGTELLLGEQQWAAFMDTDPTIDDFAEIAETLNEAAGN